ncbi:MAG: hypothetical protein DYG89_06250 [Caldilinea sp. CFX5]|nr:hypothetical protein [Caldilinea sp. CFX5]
MKQHKASDKATLQWTGILFAVAVTLLLVTVVDLVIGAQGLAVGVAAALRLLAPIVAGVLTTLYVRRRGGIHAFIGALIALPLMALFVFHGNWQSAVLATMLCALAGAVSEVLLRNRG